MSFVDNFNYTVYNNGMKTCTKCQPDSEECQHTYFSFHPFDAAHIKAAIGKLEKIANKKYQIKYRESDKGKATKARSGSKRRALIIIESTLTANEWNDIKKRYRYKCVYCGENKPLTMDHIIPISKGGHHTKENILPACHSCNSIKGNRPVLLQILAMS